MIRLSLIVLLGLTSITLSAQVNWLNFQQLDSALQVEKKPVVVFLEAEWCVYCEKMKRESFTDSQIQSLLNEHFYAVSLDIEDEKAYRFNEEVYENSGLEKYHSLAYLFATAGEEPITPTLAVLDDRLAFRQFEQKYLSRKQLTTLLSKTY